jgi:oligopeptide/dipeptide ABC transporter ATP-binding protein
VSVATDPLLRVEDLRAQFVTRRGVIHAVDGVSFCVEPGRTLGLVGESGCGKSVTALSLLGLVPPPGRVTGRALFGGQDLIGLAERQLEDTRGRQIGMIFQDPMTSLNPTVPIGKQIAETLRRHLPLSRADARRRTIELLEEVHIASARERYADYPHQFSGGMRQRVMIAIAIACKPRLLIADEPTTALDVTVQAQILDLLDELRREHNMAIILITHDLGVVAETADDVAVMYAGQIVEQAETTELFAHPEHPYTEALRDALPQLEGEGIRERRLAAIPGRPPDLLEPPPICRFAPRCPWTGTDRCDREEPRLRQIRPGHLVRSFHPASERAARQVPA